MTVPPPAGGRPGLPLCILRAAVLLGLFSVTAGCVLSLDPVVPEADAAFDARLLGTWEETSGSGLAVISRAGDDAYEIAYSDDDGVGQFEARLGRLGGRLVLDVWPAPGDDLPEPYVGTLIAGHLLFALDVGPDEIRTAALEPDSLLDALEAGVLQLTYKEAEDQLLLLGTTGALRAALGAYLDRPGALAEPDVWQRIQEAEPPPPPIPAEVPCFEAAAWRGADQLFHRDPRWVGADVASSVDLGDGRVLWLFGDTWIDPTGAGTRRGARMVANTVAIQDGADPATSGITFYWGRAADGSPAPFFADRGDEVLWFGNGVRVEDRLILFLARTLRTGGEGLGFESTGWTAMMVENPEAEPPAWRVHELDTPANPLGILVGFGAAFERDGYVYALGSQDPVKSHPVFAARWPVAQARAGDLRHAEWWAGERLGWVPDASSAPRRPLFENGQSELTVHQDPVTQQFVEVQSMGFGPADLVMRAAPALTGPWSAPRLVYRPAEYYRPNVMIYAAKAHPHLAGGDLVLTYATNTTAFGEHLTDSLIYYPRFVRLTRCM